jgi:hypothetical protein
MPSFRRLVALCLLKVVADVAASFFVGTNGLSHG